MSMSRNAVGLVLATAVVVGIGTVVAVSSGDDGATVPGPGAAAGTEVLVYRSPACGCCLGWAEHLREAGFRVRVEDRDDLGAVKADLGVPLDLSSCHTARVGGYVVEGHVPASDIRRLLDERPDVQGLAVPGMPVGSPGMEGPDPEPYDVVAFDGEGDRTVFATH